MAADASEREPSDREDESIDPSEIGEHDAPSIAEQPYKLIFEANSCIATGRCAEVSSNWEMDLMSGLAAPQTYFFGEEELEHNVLAAEACPAKNGKGVIHVIDRRTNTEIAPDPDGDGTLSVDW